MDIDRKAAEIIWRQAAQSSGWTWSAAHAGFISADHVDVTQYGEGGHASDVAAEDACFLDGIGTLEQAVSVVRNAA